VPKVPTIGPAKTKDDAAEEPKLGKIVIMPEILSPPAKAELPKVQKAPVATPKRKRMASVLDAVMETTKALSPAPTKKVTEAIKVQAGAEAGPSVPIETKAIAPEDKVEQQTSDTGMATGQGMIEKQNLLPPKLRPKMLITLFDMLRGKIIQRRNLRSQTLRPETKISEGGLSV
jgi:type IV secretory pathway VirB10-like protein